ncbi:GFA family protein [Sphingomicrobium sediminis]|uniref:GFA family protein n=1 Tax=Sphingomicrobium sediminis TaxID=2950949 RepID=A0A9X2J0V8_9SPHN|nr:GFA family protein [Sphingomicrobium sediminis]MCM8556658.1 GFA family protein [Sphingomicrobium sediminis]
MKIEGKCACGEVQFELSEKPVMLGTCHCSRCRKAGASALAFVKGDTVSITAGREFVTTWKAVEPYKYDRFFCSRCGTSLGDLGGEHGTIPINAHCLDNDVPMEHAFHEFVSEKPSWLIIGDDAAQYPKHPPMPGNEP